MRVFRVLWTALLIWISLSLPDPWGALFWATGTAIPFTMLGGWAMGPSADSLTLLVLCAVFWPEEVLRLILHKLDRRPEQ